MRIALMTNNYKPFLAGVPISIERLAIGLEQLGHEVTVFAPTYKEQVEETNCFRYRTLSHKFVGGIVLPNPLDSRIEKEFKKRRYDIIHVHHPMLIGRTAIYLSQKYNIPLVFTYHTRYEQYLCYSKGIQRLQNGAERNTTAIDRIEKKLLYGIQEKLVPAYLHSFLKHCSHVFAPTAGMKDYLMETCNYPCEQIDVLPTGIEQRNFEVTEEQKMNIRKKYNAEDIPLFLTVSRMAHEKNVSFLLKSIALLKQKLNKPFRVLIVGDGPQKTEYEETCKLLGIEEEVNFTGNVLNEEIPPYFSAADAFIFASKTETQGIVVLEAFAGSTPVIAVDATGVSDLVEDGVNGFLCPEEIDVFAQKILDFIMYQSIADTLSKGAERTAQEFRQEAVALKAIQLYNRVIAKQYAALGNDGLPTRGVPARMLLD